mmetsp:Transcript_24296/g.50130  ORF Transcript_24296/g.50130 Transcript_24296/m.50130 type:complete len:364 (+) Transcript_24296:138-1229(+)
MGWLAIASMLPLIMAVVYMYVLYAGSPSTVFPIHAHVSDLLGLWHNQHRMTVILAQIGALSILRYLYVLYKQTLKPIIKFMSTPPKNISDQGKWVVLSNIVGNPAGEAFARHLAEEGCDIILLGVRGRTLDGFVSDLDKYGYATGNKTVIEAVKWDSTNNNDGECWSRLAVLLGSAMTDGGLGLVVHCCSNSSPSGAASSSSSKTKQMHGPSSLSANMLGTEEYSRKVIQATLPQMAFRNQGGIVCLSSDTDGEPYPDRNDLLDCSPARQAYTRKLVTSLYHKYRPLGIDCLSVLEYPYSKEQRPPPAEGVMARLVLTYLGPPSADTVVEASLKALGRQPVLTASECLFAQACRYSEQYEEKI